MTGIMITIIASLETMLSIEAIDALDPKRRVTNTNRELVAQGAGNLLAGCIGGLPVTSVIVRSSANLNAGAQSKASAIIHGLLLFVCVVTIPSILNQIPLSALAAILFLTGYKLCKLSVFRNVIKNGKYQYIPFFITVAVIISIDLLGVYKPLRGEGLLVGVMAGVIVAFIGILHGNLKNSYYFHREKHQMQDKIQIQLSEEVSFLNKASIRLTLSHIPEQSHVVIDASKTQYIDFDVLELIKEFRDYQAPSKQITCELIGFKESYKIENTTHVHSVH